MNDDSRRQKEARKSRARSNWTPTGPQPKGPEGDETLILKAGETLDCFAGHWMIFQLKNGHRYSTDDLLAAAFALEMLQELGKSVERVLDLGAGIGSVGLFLTWALPDIQLVGVEKQAQSLALAQRTARYNGVDHRSSFILRDLKQGLEDLGKFPLITGSPPYWAEKDGSISEMPQKGPCRFELTGALEDYCVAAASALTEEGLFCVVFDGRQKKRLLDAFEAAGLSLLCIQSVISKVGRPPLMVLAAGTLKPIESPPVRPPLELRLKSGFRTEAFRALRLRMGLPPGKAS